jgi:CHAT domain-containing protein
MTSHARWKMALLAGLAWLSLGALAQGTAEAARQAALDLLAKPAPREGTASSLSEAYLERAKAARTLDDTARERAELDAGIQLVGQTEPGIWLRFRLTGIHGDRGDFLAGLAEAQRMVAAARAFRGFGWEHWGLSMVASYQVALGLNGPGELRQTLAELNRVHAGLRSSRAWAQYGELWQTQLAWTQGIVHRFSGHPVEAAASFQACLAANDKAMAGRASDATDGKTFYTVDCSSQRISALLSLGQLAEAAAIAAQYRTLLEDFSRTQDRPGMIARTAFAYASLSTEQGQGAAAQATLDRAERLLSSVNASEASLYLVRVRELRALIEMLDGRWAEAERFHRARADGLQTWRQGNVPLQSANWAYTLIRLGRAAEALEMMRTLVQRQAEFLDEQSLALWDSRAFLGLALAANGQRREGMAELSRAVPKVLQLSGSERTSGDAGVVRTRRLQWMLDGYIQLLADQAIEGDAAAMDEAFRMADIARGSSVQRALAASSSRAGARDPALADLARREQDLQREISSLSDALNNLLSRGRLAEQDKIVADIRSNVLRLRQEHAQVQADIGRRFPDYASLLNPQPVGIAAIQKLLKPTEALVSVYAGTQRTLVWAVPAQGTPRFVAVDLPIDRLDRQVMELREALDPNAEAVGKLPAFPFGVAHELYRQLLLPVESGWAASKELIVIPHSRLGQLPLGVLTTAPFSVASAPLAYAEMADAPWLLKQVAVSQLPAAVALPALRSGTGRKAERAFIGFGDPVFTAEASSAGGTTRGAGASMRRRNLVVAPAASPVNAKPELAPPINFRLLQALPDTALEVEEVATVLSADKARDVLLQRNASEARVKRADLSPYRVVMFATHGLMNGEMPGLYQPALALSNPALTGDGEDGMLTMEEILGLKLNAEWVVLSACNSAAAGGQSTESVSGLGRAFFYAGAKSLLVTNWAVETESARMLTTELFRRQAGDPALSRARALQQSSLELMKRSAGQDYSYAHPMFWAPYSLVGDGGM